MSRRRPHRSADPTCGPPVACADHVIAWGVSMRDWVGLVRVRLDDGCSPCLATVATRKHDGVKGMEGLLWGRRALGVNPGRSPSMA